MSADPGEPFDVLLHRRADEAPDRVAFTFRSGPPESPRLANLTHAELLAAARALAHALVDAGQSGRPVLLAFAPGLDFVVALFGALIAGATAVPVYPPTTPEAATRVLAAARATGATHAVSSPELGPALAALPGLTPSALTWLHVDRHARATTSPALASRPDRPRILQLTSGTTRAPRPVALHDRQLAANSEVIRQRFGHDAGSVGVIWLPPYHDMGLVGGILQPLWVGFPVVLLSPLEMLARPERWLAALSDHRATTSGGPDFAYALAARKVPPEVVARLDLRAWRVAFSGAERVRARTLDAFAAAFAPAGFDPRAFHPCYGLAEATLYATGVQGIVKHPDDPALVSSGVVAPGHALRVVDPETGLDAPPDTVGRVALRGPAGAADAPDDDGWLVTDDLGRVRDDHLYLVGRLASRMKIRGRLVHAEDVEDLAGAADPTLRAGRAAAFTLDDGERELLVLVHEARAAPDPEAVRRAVDRALGPLGLALDALVLAPPGAVPVTSSGKVRREACRAALLDGSLASWTPEPFVTPRRAAARSAG
ncbi:MAG: AMP-binding protein [Deltaproteobacteria bacterium]|nr:AMP-binding protein [Deltaproteobacteria bacterium]